MTYTASPAPREFDLRQADEIFIEYGQPGSMIDSGNLFFAGTEYQDAYKELQREAESLRNEMVGIIDDRDMGRVEFDRYRELVRSGVAESAWKKDNDRLTSERDQERARAQRILSILDDLSISAHEALCRIRAAIAEPTNKQEK